MIRSYANSSAADVRTRGRHWFGWLAGGWTFLVALVWGVVVYDGRREREAMARVRAEEISLRELEIHGLMPGPARVAGLGGAPQGTGVATASEPRVVVRRDGVDPSRLRVRWIGVRPMRPENAPDDWERGALEHLRSGEGMVNDSVKVEGRETLRHVREAVALESCLKCHGADGHRTGDLVGGVGVLVPLDAEAAPYLRSGVAAQAGLFSCWLLGLLGLRRGLHDWRRRWEERAASEQTLRESERRFRVLAEQAPVGICETDPAGRYTYVNRRWAEMTGVEPTLAAAADWIRSVHPDDRSAVLEGRIQELDQKGETRREYRCVHADGRWTWVQGSTVALREDDGRVTGLLGVTMDVGERRRAEEALRASEARFRELFEEGPVGMAVLDAAGGFRQSNKALLAWLGVDRAGLEGRSVVEFCDPEDEGRCRALLEHSAGSAREPGSAELRWRRCDGAGLWAILTTVLLPGGEGAPAMRLAMFQDTTAHREDEIRLRQQAALLDIAQDAICVLSLDGRVEFWNPAAERLYGWSRGEALGKSGDELLFGCVSAELLEARAAVLAAGFWSGELQHAAKGGRIIHVQSRFSLVRDERGQPRSVLVVGTDLTERKRLEQQFLRAQRMECVGALASGIAHDLNNVFAPILMVSECLSGRPVSPMDAELLELLRSSADRGAGVVRQLLSFSRGQGMARTELRLDHLMKEMGRLANETFPKNIRFSMTVTPDLWLVVADPTQLHQVLLNLCVNARDAMPSGGELALEVRNLRTDEIFCQINPEARPGTYVLLEVADTGEGIPEEIRDRIFDPFFTTKSPGKGTGLGLSTVLNIVRAHGGFIEVHSRPGEGTRFRIFLPAVAHGTAASPEQQVPQLPAGAGECVLVVDDEEAICRVAKQLLERHGYRPLAAQDAVDALAQFGERRGEVRVVITDMMMPDMDGVSFIRAIRRVAGEIPIVAMSGSAAELRDVGFAAQRNISFLEKPFTAEQLLVALHGALRPAGAGGVAPAGATGGQEEAGGGAGRRTLTG